MDPLSNLDQIVEPQQSQGTTINPHEEAAIKAGWRPQEEWEGDLEDWVDAKEFNRRGEYMDRIKSQSSTIKKLEKRLAKNEEALDALADHHRKVQEDAYKKALNDLKGLKREALDIGDNEKVVDIDDRIDELKRVRDKEISEQQTNTKDNTDQSNPEVDQWLEDNSWYKSDLALQGAMNAIVQDLVKKDPSLFGKTEALDMAKELLQEEFPQKFKRRASAVSEPTSGQGTNKTSGTTKVQGLVRKLTAEQRRFADGFIKAGAIKSYEEYAQQLHDIGEI